MSEDELGEGEFMVVKGKRIEFFTIGQVARAIGRQSGTLRTWESKQIIPKANFIKRGKDQRGDRRLYSRAQAEGIIRLAKECHVMDAGERRPLKEFERKVWALFNELREANK